jgi:hypothetical protein
MANRPSTKAKKTENSFETRRRRQQQILFAILAGVIILSWILSLLVQI